MTQLSHYLPFTPLIDRLRKQNKKYENQVKEFNRPKARNSEIFILQLIQFANSY